jgi:carbonic anhydrase
MISLKLLIPIFVAIFLIIRVDSWGYVDQEGWSLLHGSSCGGIKQSPIDLPDICKKGSGSRVNPRLSLELINYDIDIPPSVLTMKNNGHTAVITLKDSKRPNPWNPKISGSVVSGDEYQLMQLHFHWDRTNNTLGSEHGLHGSRRAMEMHLVHFNTRYNSPAEAGSHGDGFAVMAIFFDNTDDDENNNPQMNKIVFQLREISAFNSSVQLKRPLNLRRLLPQDIDTFYTYEGSLTTPPCSEIITWVIFPEVQSIGPNQLFAFERALDTDGENVMGRTCRDLQPLNQRTIYASSDNHCRGNSARPATSLVSSNSVLGSSYPTTGSSTSSSASGSMSQQDGVVDDPPQTTKKPRKGRRPIPVVNGQKQPGLVPGLLQGLLG